MCGRVRPGSRSPAERNSIRCPAGPAKSTGGRLVISGRGCRTPGPSRVPPLLAGWERSPTWCVGGHIRPASHPTDDHQTGDAPGPGLLGHTCMICGFGWQMLSEEPLPTDTRDHHPLVARFRVCTVVERTVDARNSRSPTGPAERRHAHDGLLTSVSAAVTAGVTERLASPACSAPRSAERTRLHGQVDVMGRHRAGRTHGVDTTMKSRLGGPFPTRAASRSRAEPGFPCVPPARLDFALGTGLGGRTTEPRGRPDGRPRPAGTPLWTRPSLPGATRPAVVPLPPAQDGCGMLALRSSPGRGRGRHVRCPAPREPGRRGDDTTSARPSPGAFRWRWFQGRAGVITDSVRGRPHPAGLAPSR